MNRTQKLFVGAIIPAILAVGVAAGVVFAQMPDGDHHGDNAHRTVESLEWWFDLFDPDEAVVDRRRREATFWKRVSDSKVRGGALGA